MAKFFELVESEDSVTLHLPAPQRLPVVLALTFATPLTGFGVLWWGYRWLATTSTVHRTTSVVAASMLLFVEAVAIRALLLELAVATLTFERTTIGIRRAFLGISLADSWHNCYRIAHFSVIHDVQYPEHIRSEFTTNEGQRIVAASRIPTDCFTGLVHLLRRKQFAYFEEEMAT